jgi:hypothetical protein
VWRKSSFSEGGGDSSCVEVGHWRKSSFSQGNGDSACVEVGHGANVIAVRDSKNTDGGLLTFTATTWHTFQTTITD